MVKASITNYGFDIQGHANYDDYGYDIVCSAISALSQSVAIALNNISNVTIQNTNGWITVDIKEPNQNTLLLLNVLRIGLTNISTEYPKHLKLRVKRGVF